MGFILGIVCKWPLKTQSKKNVIKQHESNALHSQVGDRVVIQQSNGEEAI